MQKTWANISIYKLSKFSQKIDLFLSHLNQIKGNVDGIVSKSVVKLGKSKPSSVNTSLIGKESSSMTPPFLLTFDIFNKNVHNCLIDCGESSIVMPYASCKKLTVECLKNSS